MNHIDLPLVSVILVCFEGNAHLLPRAIASIRNQDLPDTDLQLIIFYDGNIQEDCWVEEAIQTACHGCTFPVNLLSGHERTGFHVVPRNKAIPHALGSYIVNMDGDNEFAPNHLSSLLSEIRKPLSTGKTPDFVYSRRTYVKDSTCKKKVPEGKSPYVEWSLGKLALAHGPQANFVDTGDMMIPAGILYELADRTGCVWNSNLRRYPDFDLVKRMAQCGFEGKAVDNPSNIYHWTGDNVQLTSGNEGVVALPERHYENAIVQGLLKGSTGEKS